MALAGRKLRKAVSKASDSVERRIRFVASFARSRFGWWNLIKVACRDMVLSNQLVPL